jgi:hypothetical protein
VKIRMLKTQRGAEDGFTLRTYEEGHEYEIGGTQRADDLAAVFLHEGWAEPIVQGTVVLAEPAIVVAPEDTLKRTDEVLIEVDPPSTAAPVSPRRKR